MPVHLGIACNWGRVHFVASSNRIEISSAELAMNAHSLVCFCGATTYFSREQLRPYRVSEETFHTGYARLGEYEMERTA